MVKTPSRFHLSFTLIASLIGNAFLLGERKHAMDTIADLIAKIVELTSVNRRLASALKEARTPPAAPVDPDLAPALADADSAIADANALLGPLAVVTPAAPADLPTSDAPVSPPALTPPVPDATPPATAPLPETPEAGEVITTGDTAPAAAPEAGDYAERDCVIPRAGTGACQTVPAMV